MTNKTNIKIGIYLCALLMMGAIAIASNIANIIAAFPHIPPTRVIASLISVPCLVVIPVTIITGKLMDYYAKKTLVIIGVLIWFVGGISPYFITDFTIITITRAFFGIGIGMVQTLCAALIVENFEEQEERSAMMGKMTAFQMLGNILFSLIAGNLGKMGWNVAFLVHGIAILSLVGAIVCLPYKNPKASKNSSEVNKFKATSMMWTWATTFGIFMIATQTYAGTVSSLLLELELGDSAVAGNSIAVYAFGGLFMGLAFGKFAKTFGKWTCSLACLQMMIAFILIVYGKNLLLFYVAAFIAGASTSIGFAGIVNGTASSVDQKSSSMAVSIATCLQNVGLALCPYIVNPLGAKISSASNKAFTASQGTFLSAVGILLFLAIVLAYINLQKKQNLTN